MGNSKISAIYVENHNNSFIHVKLPLVTCPLSEINNSLLIANTLCPDLGTDVPILRGKNLNCPDLGFVGVDLSANASFDFWPFRILRLRKHEKEVFQLFYFYYHMVKEVSVYFPILPLHKYVSGYPVKLLFLEIVGAFS